MLILAIALRLLWLGQASLQVDEVATLLRAAQWRSQPFEDVHPPLFFALVEVWSLGGLSEAWLRGLSVVASGLSLLAFWKLLEASGVSRRECGFALLLLACSFADLQQAREIRMYAWLQLWSVLYLWALAGNRLKLSLGFLLAALYTHLFGVFLIPIGWALRKGLRYPFLALALWLPWAILHYASQRGHPLDLRQAPTLWMALEAPGRLVGGRVAPFGDPLSLGLGIGLLVFLALARPRAPHWVKAWALLPWLTVWLVSTFTPIQLFEFKYLVWTLPAWIWLLVSSRGGWAWAFPWLALNLGLAWPWLTRPHDYLADWRGVAHALRRYPPELPVIVHPSMMSLPLRYYGVPTPPLEGVDEWGQLQPGRAMLWVTTPHHPFVFRQGLLVGVERFWREVGRHKFSALLPSSQIWLIEWRWKEQQGPSVEK